MSTLSVTVALTLAAGPLAAQCALVADLTPGNANNGNISYLTPAFGHELWFTGHFSATGGELWRWRANVGTQIVVDLVPGSGSSNPQLLTPCVTALGRRMFYTGFQSGHGRELYVSDGTPAGTGRVLEIMPGSGGAQPRYLCASDGLVYFNARDPNFGEELWVSDGTAAGTSRLTDVNPGPANGRPEDITAWRGVVFFSAEEPSTGRELYVSDGTVAGTQRLLDINPGAASSNPEEFVAAGDWVYFVATRPTTGREVWRTDGTAAGTALVNDTFPHNSFGADGLCALGDRVLFHEASGAGRGRLFVSDGTAAGTIDLSAGSGLSAGDLVRSGDRVFFYGHIAGIGGELGVTDGTVAGTQIVVDLVPSGSASPNYITDCGPGVIFRANVNASGDLWFSDGTAAGTFRVCNLDPAGAFNPDRLTMLRGRLFFEGYEQSVGRELFGVATPGATATLLGETSGPGHPRLATMNGDVPVLGATVDLTSSGPAGATGFLVAGGPRLPVPVPASLIDGGADWVGLQAGLAVHVATSFTPNFTVPFSIPNNPAFEGAIFQFQTVWFDPATTPQLQVSNAMQLVVGTSAPH